MNNYLKITLTLLLAAVLLGTFSVFFERGQKKYHIHKYNRIHEIFGGKKAYDILFLGSSRTHTTIYPKIIDSVTKLKSFNAGAEGGNLYEFKLTLDGYLVHHDPPKLVVVTLDAISFDLDRLMFFPMQYFASLDNLAVREAFRNNTNYQYFILKYLPLLRSVYCDDYTKNLALKGLAGQNEISQQGAFEYAGFLSNGYQCVDTQAMNRSYKEQYLKIQNKAVSLLQSIIQTCRRNNLTLIFTYAPEYRYKLQKSFVNFYEFIDMVNKFSKHDSIPFYRDDSLSLCKDPCFFSNYGHVNVYGAFAYSKVLGERILEMKNNGQIK